MKLSHIVRPIAAAILFAMVTPLAVAADDKPEMVDNPSYKAWSGYKPGTFATHQGTTNVSMGGQEMKSTMELTIKLVEVTSDHVVVETSATIDMSSMGGGKQAMPAQKQTIPAKIAKDKADMPPGMNYDQGKTEFKEIGSGKEGVNIKGKQVETTFREYDLKGKQEGKDMTGKMKVWTSDSIPGGMVKTESSMDVPTKMALKMALSDFKVEK